MRQQQYQAESVPVLPLVNISDMESKKCCMGKCPTLVKEIMHPDEDIPASSRHRAISKTDAALLPQSAIKEINYMMVGIPMP